MLPIHATFCANCGERVDRQVSSASARGHTSFAERYRITSLARRGPYVQLSFALDTQNQRPVVVRDIDISGLTEEASREALAATQAEYDLLRRQSIPDITPLIDLRATRYHLYTVAGWPFPVYERQGSGSTHRFLLNTLQDLLQSGIGLPGEQVAISWGYRLCRALEGLHEQQIIIGDLDPHAIIVSSDSYRSLPALVVSWLPAVIRELLSYSSRILTFSSFSAPEIFDGAVEKYADIYSLGAILYLLLTGTSPQDARERTRASLRAPREYNASVSGAANAIVMRALSLDPAKRFQSAGELAEALYQLDNQLGNATQISFSGKVIANLANSLTHTAAPVKPEQPIVPPKPEPSSTEIQTDKYISSVEEDNKIEEHEKTQPGPASDDEVTISIAPIQAALARMHQSRIAPQDQITHEKQGGEMSAKKEQPQQEQNEGLGKEYAEDASEERAERVAEHAGQPAAEVAPTPGERTHELLIERTGAIVEQHEAPEEAEQETNGSHESAIAQEDVDDETGAEADLEEDEEDGEELAAESAQEKASRRFKQLFSSSLPALIPGGPKRGRLAGEQVGNAWGQELFKSLQRFFLGEQRRITSAAAIIETPMRVQPNQNYALRIHIMGRNEPGKGAQAGLSSLVEGKGVHIEVRSALYKNYAYVVQQADVQIPARGYAAEVTIPMHALSQGKGGRRERLQIILLDEQRRPLYEKPFIIELFISPLVHSGQEGHNVLSIPL